MKDEEKRYREECIKMLKKGDFWYKDHPGFLVTCTSKETGKTMIRYCKDELEAEEFVDYASSIIDEKGKAFWSRTPVSIIKTCDFFRKGVIFYV